VRGPEHPETATELNNLGFLLQAQGDFAAAQPLYRRALAIWERVLGHDNLSHAPHLLAGTTMLARF
jgi:hypothetical protein